MADERFFDEFAEDFFAESTEHLETVRACLLEIEDYSNGGQPLRVGRAAALMRSLHTIKGLCGMVGINEAASVTHAMEELLRAADLESARLAPPAVRAVFNGAATLEQCLKAYRGGTGMPDVQPVIEVLHQVAREGAEAAPFAAAAPQESRSNYTFTFTPTADLAARGVGVELVRTRLHSLGEVQRVMPRVTESGSIVFEFHVLVEPDRAPQDEWRQDGMAWQVDTVTTTPAPAPPVDATTTVTTLFASRLVRVDLGRLDELMLLAGELVMSRARLQDDIVRLRHDRSTAAFNAVEDSNTVLERQLRDLRAAIMRVRLVPIGEVFERMRFVARDVARETGKQVRIEVEGGNTEIDKVVVERMVEPLLHLVRNAVSHGIEPAAARMAAGKDEIGLISLRARSAGDQIIIEVSDDGSGMDAEGILAMAAERGIEGSDLLDVLCRPGFSTRSSSDLSSGRGVGMDVVKKTVETVGGELRLETEKGHGSRFVIRLPLTLMIVDALLVLVGNQTYAIPQPSLREVLQIDTTDIVSFENNEVLRYRDAVLPLIRLRNVFATSDAAAIDRHNVLVVGSDTFQMGLVADRIIGLREIVVRSVADPLVSVPGIAGAAELSDGSVALILDANGLIQYANQRKLRLA
jgi:two-component system, chemotaxis family, sensor kinase CheA